MPDPAGSLLLKIDGVASADEAKALQEAGANAIGITVMTGRGGDPPRSVSRNVALAIREALSEALLCVTVDIGADDAEAALRGPRNLSADMLQIPPHDIARDEWREALDAEGLQLVLESEEISHGDTPELIEQRFGYASEWTAPLLQVSLSKGLAAPWSIFRRSTEHYDLLLPMRATPDETSRWRAGLPACGGFYLRLGTEGITPALPLLAALRA